ncbi:hypothetical protein EDD86DRAFT_188519 [Gorgonomyces haynaldii]|nr:hypothetical protein EDD86DRAFT_188519 [Gorgonomyces haynaldii]
MQLLGLAFLLVSIVAFVAQSEIVQSVQTGYYKPFFLLYIAHSCYLFFLPIQIIICSLEPDTKWNTQDWQMYLRFVTRVGLLTLFFTLGALLWYVSVSKIPMGDLTAIYNTSCFFTYLLSLWILKEPFQWQKITGVLCSVAGICFISLWTRLEEKNDVLGYTAAILSSVLVALYETLYTKLAVPPRPTVFFSIHVVGLIGVLTLVFGSFMFPILHFLEWETFQLPPNDQWINIGLISLLGVIFNALFMLSMSFLGPVIASVGILLSIPATTLVDVFFGHSELGWNIIIGGCCIVIGFLFMNRQ